MLLSELSGRLVTHFLCVCDNGYILCMHRISMGTQMKKNVMIRIDEILVRKAKEYGLNISKVSENALKEMIRRIEAPVSSEKSSNNPQKSGMVARGRFELPSAGPEPAILDH